MSKQLLCIDFDGVLHSYTSGWKGAATAADPPVPGAIEFLRAAIETGFRVAVFSSRSGEPAGMKEMQRWLAWHADLALVEAIEWPVAKPAAFLTIDDRAWRFEGVWPGLEEIRAFKPWNRR